MTLTTTGHNAEAYADFEYAEAYATDHFIGDDKTVWDQATQPTVEASLRQATQFIDSRFRDRFPGAIRTWAQALEWPRYDAFDRSGRYLAGVPEIVKQATVELAKERIVAGNNLTPTVPAGAQPTEERVEGVVTVKYNNYAVSEPQYRFAERLLSAVLKGSANRLVRV